MAVNLTKAPQDLSFSGNQIVFGLQSTDYLVSEGETFVGYIQQVVPWTVATSFVFQFGDERVVMQGSYYSDDSGTRFVVGDTVEVIATYFRKNYILNNYFEITTTGTRMYFKARKPGSFYNWKPSTGLVIEVAGEDRKERPGFKFLFEVFLENEAGTAFDRIYSEKPNADLPLTGKLSIDIHDILDAALSPDMPDFSSAAPFRCPKSKRRFFCRYAQVHGDTAAVQQIYETPKYHVISGGLSYLGHKDQTALERLRPGYGVMSKDRFLKQHTGEFRTHYDQPEFLYFVNIRGPRTLYLKTVVEYTDGETAELLTMSISSILYEKIAFAVGWDQQQLSLLQPGKLPLRFHCSLVDENEDPRSETITYIMNPGYEPWCRSFLYTSSLGAFDSFLTYGKQAYDAILEQQTSESPKLIDYQVADGTKKSYALSYQRNFVVNTGWLSQKAFDLLTDFYLAEEKYLYESGKLIPLSVTNKKIGERRDGNSLIRQEISCTLNFTDDKFTDNDMEGTPPVLPPIDGQIRFGYSATRPTTEAAVLALPESQTDAIKEFILHSGTTQRYFTVAFRNTLTLTEAWNQTSEEDVLSEFLENTTTIVIGGIPCTVCTAIAGVHYLVDQEIFIKLTNG